MLTDVGLQDLLRTGYEASDIDFVAHSIEHMNRAVYFMARFLSESQYRFISSVELQDRIDNQLWTSGISPEKRFNAVDWFSAEWTKAKKKQATEYFADEYLELFDRNGEEPTWYRIKPALFERVVAILSELHPPAISKTIAETNVPDPRTQDAARGSTGDVTFSGTQRTTVQELSALADQLDRDGIFDPTNLQDAQVRVLRAVAVREGQPRFRAALLSAYGSRCAITECDAAPALEAAHIKPYESAMTNVVSNGILLRADIHTLFDLNLIGIRPRREDRAHLE